MYISSNRKYCALDGSNDILNFKFPEIKQINEGIANEEKLYVILPFYNFAKAKRRTQLFLDFLDLYKNLTMIRIIIAEATIEDEFQLPNNLRDNVYMHLKYKLEAPFWCKENLINVAVSKLYFSDPNWKYVAWIDADITFLNQNWAQDTIKKLKSFHYVQLFKRIFDIDKSNKFTRTWNSFAYEFTLNREKYKKSKEQFKALEGFAWSCTRWAFEKIQGLLDVNIVGGGDKFMKNAFLNQLENWILNFNMSENYFNLLRRKQRIVQQSNLKIGFIEGNATHNWHGYRGNRKYLKRYEILHNFDPQLDLIRNCDGILNLNERGKRMKNEIMQYFIGRKEDE